MASAALPPSSRVDPFIASAGDLTYLWGGEGDTEPEAVFLYRHDTETWTRRLTSGVHPPAGLSNGGCITSHHSLYLYGGCDKNGSYSGILYELNLQTWQWTKLSDGISGGPGKKIGCRLTLHHDQLLVFGGCYKKMPNLLQIGANYENDQFGTSVYTNEVHGYCLTSGMMVV